MWYSPIIPLVAIETSYALESPGQIYDAHVTWDVLTSQCKYLSLFWYATEAAQLKYVVSSSSNLVKSNRKTSENEKVEAGIKTKLEQ